MEKKSRLILLVAVFLFSSIACRTFYKFTGDEFAGDAALVTPLPTLTPPTVLTSPPSTDLILPSPTDPVPPPQQPTTEVQATEAPPDPGLFIQDDFSDRESGWSVEYADNWITDYFQDGYHILINSPETIAWSVLGLDYADVRVTVDARMIGGEEDNYLGVVCRYQNAENFYAAVISSDGYYGVLRRTQGGAPEVISGEYFVESIVINQHINLNLIEVSCVGSQIKLIVNGQQLADVTDTTIPSGDVGLIVGTFSAASTDVLFDNFAIHLEE